MKFRWRYVGGGTYGKMEGRVSIGYDQDTLNSYMAPSWHIHT